MISWNSLVKISRIGRLSNLLNNRIIANRMGGYYSTESPEQKFVKESIQKDCVVIFSKTTCGYCTMAKSVFENIGTPYHAIELNQRPNASQLQSVLQEFTGGSTVPRVFINGKFVGGGTEVRNLHREGKLMPLLAECSISQPTTTAATATCKL